MFSKLVTKRVYWVLPELPETDLATPGLQHCFIERAQRGLGTRLSESVLALWECKAFVGRVQQAEAARLRLRGTCWRIGALHFRCWLRIILSRVISLHAMHAVNHTVHQKYTIRTSLVSRPSSPLAEGLGTRLLQKGELLVKTTTHFAMWSFRNDESTEKACRHQVISQ